jgi:hypothetical protein
MQRVMDILITIKTKNPIINVITIFSIPYTNYTSKRYYCQPLMNRGLQGVQGYATSGYVLILGYATLVD